MWEFHDIAQFLPQKGSSVWELLLFQGNPGWWNNTLSWYGTYGTAKYRRKGMCCQCDMLIILFPKPVHRFDSKRSWFSMATVDGRNPTSHLGCKKMYKKILWIKQIDYQLVNAGFLPSRGLKPGLAGKRARSLLECKRGKYPKRC